MFSDSKHNFINLIFMILCMIISALIAHVCVWRLEDDLGVISYCSPL